MNRRIFTAALSALLLTGASALAQSTSWTIDKNHSQVDFAIKHAMVSTVRGSLGGVNGTVVWDDKDPTKSSVEATITSATVTTNNEARDKHLKTPDFFDVEKFPTLTFKSTSVKSVGGKLVTGFSATGTLKRSDFNFGSKFGLPTLSDEVQFTIDVEAGRQP